MVLHHIANSPGLLVIRGASLQANIFGHSDLHVVHVAPVPDWLENAIGEAEDQDILDGLFPQVVIDAIDLLFAENSCYLPVQLSGRSQVVPERLFDDDTCPALAAAIEPGCAKLLNDLRVLAGRSREVKNAVPAGSACFIQLIQLIRESGITLRIIEIGLQVKDARFKTLPDLRIHRFLARKLIDRVQRLLAEDVVIVRSARYPDHREACWQRVLQSKVIERGQEFAVRQVSCCAKDDHYARLWTVFDAQPLP